MEQEEAIVPGGDRLRYLIVVAAMIGAVLEVLDTSITNVAIPQMQGNLGATLSEIGWVNTGYIISNVIVLPITGWLAERFGRKKYFAASILLFLLPVYLQNSQHYTAMQAGMILLPSALLSMFSFMIVGPLAQKVDARILLAIGSVSFIAGAYGLSSLTTDSGSADVYWPLMARGISLGFLFIPLTVSSLGSLKPDEIGIGSGMINLTRQLGGSIGIAASSTILTQRVNFHRSSLVSYVNPSNSAAVNWISSFTYHLRANGYSNVDAHRSALAQLSNIVDGQSYMLAFNDAFVLIAVAFLLAIPLILFFERPNSGVDTSPAH